MSAGLWDIFDLPRTIDQEHVQRRAKLIQSRERWTPKDYLQQQLRGLVQQVFLSDTSPPVRQVVFSGLGYSPGLQGICRRVGEALAEATTKDVAIVGECPDFISEIGAPVIDKGPAQLRLSAIRLKPATWLLPASGQRIAPLREYLSQIRGEFEYSVLAAPPLGESADAIVMGQAADGMVLVLSAEHTRRVMARRIKQSIDRARVRLFGIVLCDREFPIPEALYRRL